MVIIRLARGGSKKRPFYTIVVSDQRRQPKGKFIERLGFYNPMANENEEPIRLNEDRIEYWIKNGAKPSERVAHLMRQKKSEAVSAA
ncbi:MAG: 30S ribosomal protein S16 [Acidiferrobacteraceae bacterium]|jgi:small subunit ribosomal protein S16|nr:30S ribosomal protein S16 [Acidiferrobacteraceae bacterium]